MSEPYGSRMCVLPPELTDQIIDRLHDDSLALAACSLTCRSWTAASQSHIFYKVSLSFARPFALSTLFESSPHIAHHVKIMDVHSGGAWISLSHHMNMDAGIPPIERIAALLANLEKLQITNIVCGSAGLRTFPGATFLHHFPCIRSLSISWSIFDRFQDCITFCAGHPLLETLELRSIEILHVKRIVPEDNPISGGYLQLRSLALRGIEANRPYINWMALIQPMLLLDTLCITSIGSKDIPALSCFLLSLGPSLKDLEIDMPEGNGSMAWSALIHSFANVIGSANSSLRRLHLHLHPVAQPDSFPWFQVVLSHIITPNIKDVILTIWSQWIEEFPVRDLEKLDEVFTQTCLAHVKVIVETREDSEIRTEDIKKGLKRLDVRGLLTFTTLTDISLFYEY